MRTSSRISWKKSESKDETNISVSVSFVMMLTIAPKLVLIFLVTIPCTIFFTRWLTKRVRPLFRRRSAKLGQLNGFVEEMLSGQKTIRAYGREEAVLEALAQGKPVLLYTPGLPTAEKNRALGAQLASGQRELKSWGVIFTDGGRRRLVTAEEARQMRQTGKSPGPGAVLTPLAREILEGKQ